MHFQDKRLYGYNAVTMATSPIFFFTTIHCLVQTYQAIKKIWLCFVLPWGGVTPISMPLLENGRSTMRPECHMEITDTCDYRRHLKSRGLVGCGDQKVTDVEPRGLLTCRAQKVFVL